MIESFGLVCQAFVQISAMMESHDFVAHACGTCGLLREDPGLLSEDPGLVVGRREPPNALNNGDVNSGRDPALTADACKP
jgi:hypothetical protein